MYIAILFLCVSGECGFAYETFNAYGNKVDCENAVRTLAKNAKAQFPTANIMATCVPSKAQTI